MLHTKFRENRPTGSGEEDFLRVFNTYGHGGHLGHVTSIWSSDFHFLVPESFHTKFTSEWSSSLRKSGLNFCMYTTLGQGQVMTLTFNTHIPSFSQLVVCIYQLSGHRLQQFLKNPLFSLFPTEKPKFPNLTLP